MAVEKFSRPGCRDFSLCERFYTGKKHIMKTAQKSVEKEISICNALEKMMCEREQFTGNFGLTEGRKNGIVNLLKNKQGVH